MVRVPTIMQTKCPFSSNPTPCKNFDPLSDKLEVRLSPSLIGGPSLFAYILYYNQIILLTMPKSAVDHKSQTQLHRHIMQSERVPNNGFVHLFTINPQQLDV